MKRLKLVSAAIVLAGATAISANAALLAYEPFSGTEGANIIGSGGGSGFSEVWQDNGSATAIGQGGSAVYSSFGLGYVDAFGNVLQTSGGSGYFQGSPTASAAVQPNRAFDFTQGLSDGTTWISLIMVRQGPTGTLPLNPFGRGVNVTFDYPTSSGGANQRVGVGNGSNAGSNSVAILSAGGNIRPTTNAPIAYPFGGGTIGTATAITNFVVLRIDQVAGATTFDNVYLWVNPADLTVEPTLISAATNVLGLFDYTIDRVRVFVGGNANAAQPQGQLYLDEIRVGTTYSDVAPVVPEPAVAAIGGLAIFALLMYRRRIK